MNVFLTLAIVAAALNVLLGLLAFFGERGFTVDLCRGPRRRDDRRFGGRRAQDMLAR